MAELPSDDVAGARAILALLETGNWLDAQTRALFVEFSLYLAPADLLLPVRLVIEVHPTGTTWSDLSLEPLSLSVYTLENRGLLAVQVRRVSASYRSCSDVVRLAACMAQTRTAGCQLQRRTCRLLAACACLRVCTATGAPPLGRRGSAAVPAYIIDNLGESRDEKCTPWTRFQVDTLSSSEAAVQILGLIVAVLAMAWEVWHMRSMRLHTGTRSGAVRSSVLSKTMRSARLGWLVSIASAVDTEMQRMPLCCRQLHATA